MTLDFYLFEIRFWTLPVKQEMECGCKLKGRSFGVIFTRRQEHPRDHEVAERWRQTVRGPR